MIAALSGMSRETVVLEIGESGHLVIFTPFSECILKEAEKTPPSLLMGPQTSGEGR